MKLETVSNQNWGTLGKPEGEASQAKLLHVVETQVATLRHAFYQAGAFVPRHRHDCGTLVYGVGGPCIERAESCELIARRLVYHPSGYEHALQFCGPTHLLAIDIRAGGSGSESAWPSRSVPLPATFYDQLWRVLLRVATGETEDAVNMAIEDLLAMVGAFADRSPPKRVMRVIDDLHRNWKAAPSIRDLSSRFEVSPQYLCRTFKRFTGVTIQQYILLLRLDQARGLLWGTGMPIAAVAAEAGFADQSHLTRVLNAHSVQTPLRLRWTAPCREWASRMETIYLGRA